MFLKYDVIFYCSHHVDEVWLRSTLLKVSQRAMKSALIISGNIPDEILETYDSQLVKIISLPATSNKLKLYSANILVSSSTSINRERFSKKIKYFCHMPHSVISLHGAYPADAFDSFNVLFACGDHQVLEFQELSQLRQKSNYRIFQSGYGKLDILLNQKAKYEIEKNHVLIAPSWGKDNIIETGLGLEIINSLLSLGYKVTLRPHSAIALYQQEKLKPYLEIKNTLFKIENFSYSEALFTSDMLITDYSGISFEHYYIQPRNIVFIETPRKIFNDQFISYNREMLEVKARLYMGQVVPPEKDEVMKTIAQIELVGSPQSIEQNMHHDIYHLGYCGDIVSNQIIELLRC